MVPKPLKLNQSQGGIYICGAMKIGLSATVKLFQMYLKDGLALPLDPPICTFHLGISLVRGYWGGPDSRYTDLQ